jgi:hypothetical protein
MYPYLRLVPAEADHLVEDEEHEGSDEEVVSDGALYEAARAVSHHQEVEDPVHVVREPEHLEQVTACVRDSEHVHHDHDDCQYHTRQACTIE